MKGMTLYAHRVSVGLMGVAVLVATVDGFAQSYAGLYHWALGHKLSGWKAETFPLLVDLFILVGELGLFALALEGHRLTRRGLSWLDLAMPFAIAAAGWGVSLAFNVGTHHQLSDRLTAAVAPVASMLGLLVLLRTMHRIVSRGVWEQRDDAEQDAEPPTLVVERTDEAPGSEPLSGLLAPDGFTWDENVPAVPAVPDDASALDEAQVRAQREFIDDITAGRVPGIRAIKQTLRIGQKRAKEVQAYLSVLAQQ